jgi:signal transduction histidine kinase
LLGQLMDRVPVRPGALHERKLVEKSRAQLARLSSLVDRLLDVTRIRSGSFDLYLENFELDVLIREVTDRFAVQDPAIPITLRLQPHIDGTWDRLRIDQIITNLVSNAVKYGMKRPIEIGASADGDQATITVRDQGAGISPEDLDRIFERFERVNLRSGIDGLGMGLWITKKIAEAHGGTVLAESEIGKGSAFIVRFPLRTNEGSADVSKRR